MKYYIKNIPHSIAFATFDRYGRRIIAVNEHLKKYDASLYDEVILHELGHFDTGNKYIDFSHEIKDFSNFKKQWKLMVFCLRHPLSLMSLSPFKVYDGKISIDLFLIVYWTSVVFLFYALLVIANG